MKEHFSVVICTCERSVSLRKTLLALNDSTIDKFEVIIVDASETNDTLDMIDCLTERIVDRIRISTINIRNISTSRNLGIKLALGDIIAFLDDDAIPPSDWIEQLLLTYSFYGDKCAGVGGTVKDMTKPGHPLQYYRGITNIISITNSIRSSDAIDCNQPQAFWYNRLMGTNSSYRRNALEKVNGFDEFFEYFLDETDLCLRLIQSGYEIHYSDVVVDHYPQPSHNRQDQKHLTCWYSLGKNTTYFALKHAFRKIPFPVFCIRLILILIYRCLLRIIRLKFTHNLSNKLIWQYIKEAIDGVYVGWMAGIDFHENRT